MYTKKVVTLWKLSKPLNSDFCLQKLPFKGNKKHQPTSSLIPSLILCWWTRNWKNHPHYLILMKAAEMFVFVMRYFSNCYCLCKHVFDTLFWSSKQSTDISLSSQYAGIKYRVLYASLTGGEWCSKPGGILRGWEWQAECNAKLRVPCRPAGR